MESTCPLCSRQAGTASPGGKDGWIVDCGLCGNYGISRTMAATLPSKPASNRALVTCYTRQESEAGHQAEISTGNWQAIVEEVKGRQHPALQRRKALRLLRQRSKFPGDFAEVNPHLDYPLIDGTAAETVGWLMADLESAGLVEAGSFVDWRLTARGWEEAEAGECAEVAVNHRSNPARSYDVAISFAGAQRKIAGQIAGKLKAAGVNVFYDEYEQHELWGTNLAEELARIYRDDATYCLMLISQEYVKRMWCVHERRHAIERFMKSEHPYLLPVRFDDAEVPGLPNTIGYVPFADHGIDGIVSLLQKKLGRGSTA